MNIFISILVIINLLLVSIISTDVCVSMQCTCSKEFKNINCDSKKWQNLTDVDFPFSVVTLTLNHNELKFDTVNDRSKIEQLNNLIDLSLNDNPLERIPPFNNSKIQSLSLHDTFLNSAEFPLSYLSSFLQTVSLSNNKIRSIRENDFLSLKNSKLKKLHIDSASLSKIDQNAFVSLAELQSLSLQHNQLKSCEFLSEFRVLSSIHLDGNQFTSLPAQLSMPGNIKNFFFTNNLISVIDDSSPLFTWVKMNRTNVKIYLANNSFDCCQSLWFIRFLNSSSYLVGDAQLLRCATPSNFAGKYLMSLNPNEMNCGGVTPEKNWGTIVLIVSLTIGGLTIASISIIITIVVIRRQRLRSGYTEIGGADEPSANAPLLTPSQDLPFPVYGEKDDDDDGLSTYSTALSRNIFGSDITSVTTATGITVNDTKPI